MEPVVTPSARKHGVADDDMLHALRNPIRVHELDEGLLMVVGPAFNGALLEVGVVTSDDGVSVVVHAMPAREKYTR